MVVYGVVVVSGVEPHVIVQTSTSAASAQRQPSAVSVRLKTIRSFGDRSLSSLHGDNNNYNNNNNDNDVRAGVYVKPVSVKILLVLKGLQLSSGLLWGRL